jgi:hypothetical protein
MNLANRVKKIEETEKPTDIEPYVVYQVGEDDGILEREGKRKAALSELELEQKQEANVRYVEIEMVRNKMKRKGF